MNKRSWILVADLILTFILERRKRKAQEELAKKKSAVKDTTWRED